jgi:hypothetical protein
MREHAERRSSEMELSMIAPRTRWSLFAILLEPGHIPDQLTDDQVVPLGNFQFDDREVARD